MTTVKILKNKPMPLGRCAWPFDKMAVGDSFEVPEGYVKTVRSSACTYGKKAGATFTVRTQGEKVFCWRVS